MSFITKRERVFNEYDLTDLPPRNEGKLKAYASCTDARAWSHFCSTKSEHLTEIIKRNNDLTVAPKYIPTKVIVDTIMVSKNMEIGRLKRKIEEFEQMLAVYEQLDLDCDQKCEIAKQHAAIKAANKNLEEMFLNLDTSGYTEGIDSEGFETGKSKGDAVTGGNVSSRSRAESIRSKAESDKSHGDEWTFEKDMVCKGNQAGMECPCDVAVSAHDPRIEEMQEELICKDAKLNAMRNSLAIMENDVCEPYTHYARIYTALEKIYGILSQNSKYKQYLDLMTAGKDIRCIDIKGKILFKMKVLEKFCLALIAPCSKDFNNADPKTCHCYRAELLTTFAVQPDEVKKSADVKRAQLFADIMEQDEINEILSKESTSSKDPNLELPEILDDRYNINEENQKRLRDLQDSYEDLVNCYENMKHDNECLRVRCAKYDELEVELERLRSQLREYTSLWNEKEHYRKRSEDLDTLKEQFMVLAEESSGLETKLKAESEINNIKASTIDELRNQNISLEKRLTEVHITFEKEKNALQCKLQESECKCICQEQQIKSLSSQIVQLLEQEPEKDRAGEDRTQSMVLMDENQALKDQIKNLQDIEDEFQDKLTLINELKGEIEDWKSSYERAFEHNKYLEDCIANYKAERVRLIEENDLLLEKIHDSTAAIDNLREVITNKSMEINKLLDDNQALADQISQLKDKYEGFVSNLESEKRHALDSLQLSRQQSQELLEKVKDYDDFVQKQEDLSNTIEEKMKKYESLKKVLAEKMDENQKLKRDLAMLQNNNDENRNSIELAKKESMTLEKKVHELENVLKQFKDLQDAYDKLKTEKNEVENELRQKASQLDNAVYSVKLNKKESGELLKQSEAIKEELVKLNLANKTLTANNDLLNRDLNTLREENENFKRKSAELSKLKQELSDLKNNFYDLLKEKRGLEREFESKNEELNNLYNALDDKTAENQSLRDMIKTLQLHNFEATNNIKNLENENLQKQSVLNTCRRESSLLVEKLQHHKTLESELDQLKTAHEQIKLEKERLQRALDAQLSDLKRIQRENSELHGHTHDLLSHNSDLEDKLISTRNQLLSAKSSTENQPYAELMQQIEKLNDDKLAARKRIRELADSLDKSEDQVSILKEQLGARDDKIAIMQNHINQLEDELRALHGTLAQAIDVGSEIKETSYHSIDQSLQQLEAHHSKATHNIKMELAMLQSAHSRLEEQLSVTKLQNEESLSVKDKYLSEIKKLKNEREIIVTDIKQIEINSVGDSELMPENCGVEKVLDSLDRIWKCFDTLQLKSASLEQTLLKVQNSSHLVISKADEAKKYFEKEKQKIISEKDDAIKDKLNMEQQLLSLKQDLEKQKSHYEAVIKDLEAESLNQKLIVDKINGARSNYIEKLKEELTSLQDLYQNSLTKICELQEKLTITAAESGDKENIIEKLNSNFQSKCKEVAELQAKLANLSKKAVNNVSTQTDNIPKHEMFNDTKQATKLNINEIETADKSTDKIPDIDIMTRHKTHHIESKKPVSELLPQQKPPSVNEVQILSASVEPSFDFVKNSYLNYKIKRLGPSHLEHHSVPNLEDDTHSTIEESPETSDNFASNTEGELQNAEDNPTEAQAQSSSNLVNIYNRSSPYVKSSSKIVDSSDKKQDVQSLNLTNDTFRTGSNSRDQFIKNQSDTILLKSINSDDKDVFIIFKDDESNFQDKSYNPENNQSRKHHEQENGFEDKRYNHEESWSSKHQPEAANTRSLSSSEPASSQDDKMRDHKKRKAKYDNETKAYNSGVEEMRLKNNKPKLKIDLPRVVNDSTSVVNTSDGDKKSLDSYIVSAYTPPRRNVSDTKINSYTINKDEMKLETPSLPHFDTVFNDESVYEESRNSTVAQSEPRTKMSEQTKYTDVKSHKGHDKPSITSHLENEISDLQRPEEESLHQLDRVEADIFLIKSQTIQDDSLSENFDQNKQNDFAMEFLLDTAKTEGGLHSLSVYGADNALPRSRSDERYNNARIYGSRELNSSFNYISSPTFSKASDKSQTKSVERSVMVKLDKTSEYYEIIIQNLKMTLHNAEKECKKKIEAIKIQYDRNINKIINEHNQGVKNIQCLHEETLQDILKVHENEVETLRSMSIEAMRKAHKLEEENMTLKSKSKDVNIPVLDDVPVRSCSPPPPDPKRRKHKSRADTKVLTKTSIDVFNVKPKARMHGPCTCSLDVNISDTIRNIFEQVDVEQRKLAELTYLKYIGKKISSGNIEALDAQELSFLHLKVCRTWKLKLSKEEALQKKIDSLEVELINKQRNARQHMAELDRKVAEEKRRLEEVREAVCRSTPGNVLEPKPHPTLAAAEKDLGCGCNCNTIGYELVERRSAGDLVPALPTGLRPKKTKRESNRAVLAKLDSDERRERRLYSNEPPTRLRRLHERLSPRPQKK